MNILFIGDVVSLKSCEFIKDSLPTLISKHKVDFIIANGENSEDGNGISPRSANILFESGVDVITTGNHVFKRRDIDYYIENNKNIIRPLNLINCETGNGFTTLNKNDTKITVLNLQGKVFMPSSHNPFKLVEETLKDIESDIIIIDMHGETTSEKRALGFFLDGKVTAVLGTHTHVQTNDAQILPKGTAYITDVGMAGPMNSVLGIDKDVIINRFLNNGPMLTIYGEDNIQINYVVINLDDEYKSLDIKAFSFK
ncbi:MAG: TIGR00282 family metallophosphoesterase [Oscillospiraceae bacterium]